MSGYIKEGEPMLDIAISKELYMTFGYTTTCGSSALKTEFNFEPKDIIFNDTEKMVIVKWSDDSKTIVKCNEDTYDRRTGFLIAYFQKASGLSKNKSNKYLDEIIEKDDIKKEKLRFKALPKPEKGYKDNTRENDLVFSINVYLKEVDEDEPSDWTKGLDGLTPAEIHDLKSFLMIANEWLIPRKDFVPYNNSGK